MENWLRQSIIADQKRAKPSNNSKLTNTQEDGNGKCVPSHDEMTNLHVSDGQQVEGEKHERETLSS